MTVCPGKQQDNALSGTFQRVLKLDLDLIQKWGVETVVTLMPGAELAGLRVSAGGEEDEARDMLWFHLPIADPGMPDDVFETRSVNAGSHLRLLVTRPALRVKRAPGYTCLSALHAGPHGSIERPINASKSCSIIMPTAPVGFLQDMKEFNNDTAEEEPAGAEVYFVQNIDLFGLGARAAALTHSHVNGWIRRLDVLQEILSLAQQMQDWPRVVGIVRDQTHWTKTMKIMSRRRRGTGGTFRRRNARTQRFRLRGPSRANTCADCPVSSGRIAFSAGNRGALERVAGTTQGISGRPVPARATSTGIKSSRPSPCWMMKPC